MLELGPRELLTFGIVLAGVATTWGVLKATIRSIINQLDGMKQNVTEIFTRIDKVEDVLVSGKTAYRLMKLAIQHGFTGIGVSQRGAHDGRFLHIDTMDNTNVHPRPWIWSYK